MKKIFMLGLIIVLLCAIGYSTISCSNEKNEAAKKSEPVSEKQKEKIQQPTDIANFLPEGTDFMVKLGSIETIYNHFSVTENSIFGEPIEEIETIKKRFGFNPFVINELKANGIDTGKGVGCSINDFEWHGEGEDPLFNMTLLLPVTNGEKAISIVKKFLQSENPTLTFSQKDNMTLFEEEELKGYIVEKDNYLFMGVSPKKYEKPLTNVLDNKNAILTDAKRYKDVISKIDSNQEIFAYLNIQKIAKKNLEALKRLSKEQSATEETPDMSKSLEYIKDYEGAGISVDLEKKDLVVNMVANIVSDSKTLNLVKGITFNKNIVLGLKENPAILLSGAMNVPEYYKMLMETLPDENVKEIKANMEDIKTEFGVDPEKEIIENLAGNFNIGIYDGISINMTNYNILMTMDLKDETMMKNVIEKAISKMPPEQQSMVMKTKIGNEDAYVMSFGIFQLYIGVKDKNLIISAGKPMFEKASNSNISSGFTAAMQDKELASTLKEDVNFFYLSPPEVFYAVKNFSAFLPPSDDGKPILDDKVTAAVNQFEYLISFNKMEGDTVFSKLILKTKFSEPFFKGLEKISEDLKAADAPAKPEENQ